jgi:anti-anti-sigma factor
MPEQLHSTEASAPASRTPKPSRFTCRVSAGSDHLSAWVHVAGEIDLVSAPGLDFVVRRAERSAQLIVIVLFDVTFMDSTGLQVISDASERAHPPDRRLVVIVSSGSQVHRLLQLTGSMERLDVIRLPRRASLRNSPAPSICARRTRSGK